MLSLVTDYIYVQFNFNVLQSEMSVLQNSIIGEVGVVKATISHIFKLYLKTYYRQILV